MPSNTDKDKAALEAMAEEKSREPPEEETFVHSDHTGKPRSVDACDTFKRYTAPLAALLSPLAVAPPPFRRWLKRIAVSAVMQGRDKVRITDVFVSYVGPSTRSPSALDGAEGDDA